jgi:GNAT superfamily N-acetyltransferase
MIATVKAQATLRTATVEDLPRLSVLATEFYSQSKMLKVFDINRFVSLWTVLIKNGSGVIFLLECAGDIIGTLGAVSHPETYSEALIAQEFFLFIAKDSRGGFGLLKLLRAFENWARERGCSEIRIAHLQDLQPAELGNLYMRMGFQRVETSYSKSL